MSGSRVLVPFVAAMLLSAGAWALDVPSPSPTPSPAALQAIQNEQQLGATGQLQNSPSPAASPSPSPSPAPSPTASPSPTPAPATAPAAAPAPNAPPGPGKLVCKETDNTTGSGADVSTTLDCDMKQRNLVVTCDTRATSAPCPNKPMAMKQTAKASFIKDYTPYLYAFARDKDDPKKAYTGAFYRGTPGDAGQTFNIFGAGSGGAGRQLGPCIQQIKLGTSVTAMNITDEAKFLRLQLDNCTNQYILHSAVFPLQKKQKEESLLFSSDDPANPGKKVDLTTHCQPLFTAKDPAQEYLADYYLKGAWKKLLNDPTYRINEDADAEPRYPSGLTLENANAPALQFPTSGRNPSQVKIADISAIPYEEINDPSHPYSPRWDFETNERDKYSPLTQPYSNDARNAVFCAGDKSSKIYKVDILSFREKSLDFDKKVKDRINFNKNCKANSGLQKNPCCKPSGAFGLTCTVRPCATCYGMTAQKPVCKTDYTSSPDRAAVKVPFLPVHPVLRVGTQIANIANLANLPANMPIAQVASMVASQASALGVLPANLPIAQATALLSGQANLVGSLSSIAQQVGTQQLGQLTSIAGNLVGGLPGGLNLGQIQSVLSGNANILSALPANLNPVQALSGLSAVSALTGALPGNLNLGDAASILTGQTNIAQSLANFSVGQASNLINSQLNQLGGLNQALTIGQALSSGQLNVQIPGLNQLPNNLPISQVSALLTGTRTGLTQFGATQAGGGGGTGVSAGQFAQVMSAQLQGVLRLPSNLPVQQISQTLGGLQTGLTSIAAGGNLSLAQIGNVLNTQALGLPQLNVPGVGSLNASQIGSILGGTGNLVSSLGLPTNALGGLQALGGIAGLNVQSIGNLTQLSSVLTGQIGNLANLGGTVGQVAGALTGQLGALSSLAGNLPIGSITGALGGIPGIPNIPGLPRVTPGGNSYPTLVVLAMAFPRTSKCTPAEFGSANSVPMATLCRKLRAPYTPINKLKMRYHNPDNDPDNDAMPKGVGEGLWFKDYFWDAQNNVAHMPYPRLWDTGRSVQKSSSSDQDPLDANGTYTAIVGVGREGAPHSAGEAAEKKHRDERCLMGGWGEDISVGGSSFKKNDPITSWTELKLYQARTLRHFGLSCIGRYEKLFKAESAEAKMLIRGGGEFNVPVMTTCEDGGVNCQSKYRFDTGSDASVPTAANQRTELLAQSVPMTWMGYLSATEDVKKFPKMAGVTPSTITGMDNAQPGDIVLMPNGTMAGSAKKGLPKMGIVTKDLVAGKYVVITESDNGKWPDTCGTTSDFGQVKDRKLYKPGNLPANVTTGLREQTAVAWTTSCDDPGLSDCEMANWNDAKLLRIRDVNPTPCDREKASECSDPADAAPSPSPSPGPGPSPSPSPSPGPSPAPSPTPGPSPAPSPTPAPSGDNLCTDPNTLEVGPC